MLADLVIGFRGLHDFKPKSPRRFASHKPADAMFHAQVVIDKGGMNYLTPDDLATIYNVNPVYNAGWDGTGQNISIAGVSDMVLLQIYISFASQGSVLRSKVLQY